jgi:hypothetical protein
MHNRFRAPTHATVVAYLALFVALGGSAYAATKVSSKQIVNNTVRTKDLRNNDVRGKDIRRGTITGSDVKGNTLTGAQINEGGLGTVPRATTAASAQALAGFDPASVKVSCPAGTELAIGLCFETAVRGSLGQEAGMNACADVGRRLPDPAELRAYARQPGVTLPEAELTSIYYNDDGVLEAVLMQETGITISNNIATARNFRCVTNPLN